MPIRAMPSKKQFMKCMHQEKLSMNKNKENERMYIVWNPILK
jgi:hypothetical protein